MPLPLVGGAVKLHKEGEEMRAIVLSTTPILVWLSMDGDSLEDRGPVLFTAFMVYTVPSPRRYQGILMI